MPTNSKVNPSPFDVGMDLEADEPKFTLAARDRSAPMLIKAWAAQRADLIAKGEAPALDALKVAEAYQIAEAMELWWKANKRKGEVREPTFTKPVTAEWSKGDILRAVATTEGPNMLSAGARYTVKATDYTTMVVQLQEHGNKWFNMNLFERVA